MDNNLFMSRCRELIAVQLNVDISTVFVVWSCKTLQNNKAILSHSGKGAPLIEMTHNGDKNELYMDVYEKTNNMCFEATR